MSNTVHERPGVYSSYDASTVLSGGKAVRTIGVAARTVDGDAGAAVTLTSYLEGLEIFGEDESGNAGMASVLRMLYTNGASEVIAAAVGTDEDGEPDYGAAFAALEEKDVDILVCDSADAAVHQLMKQSVLRASEAHNERIGVVSASGAGVTQLIERAAALNSERMVLVGPDALDEDGETIGGVPAAAAVAAAIAATNDPAVPINGAPLKGIGGLTQRYSDAQIDLLVRGGVTPLEEMSGEVSPVRGITTRTMSGEASDTTWRELTTVRIVDDVIPQLREKLRARFVRTKNTAQTRGAIRSQIIIELEKKKAAQIIDDYGEVSVRAAEDDPTVCEAEFSFAVAHGLNRIYLTAHITI